MKFVGEEFFAGGTVNAFGCSARTSHHIDKRRSQLDSARQIGLEPLERLSDCRLLDGAKKRLKDIPS